MHIIFCDAAENGRAIISGDDFRHLSVLRIKQGDCLLVSDNKAYTYRATVEEVSKNSAELLLTGKTPFAEKHSIVTLYHALCKGDKNEFTVQKAAELGADRVVLFSSENCVVKMNDKTPAKIARLNKIAREASMQCGRETVMKVDGVFSFKQAVDEFAKAQTPLFFYELASDKFSEHLKKNPLGKSVAAIVGSEGGFSPCEAEYITAKGIAALSLGKRILRTETAPVVVLSIIMEHTGEI